LIFINSFSIYASSPLLRGYSAFVGTILQKNTVAFIDTNSMNYPSKSGICAAQESIDPVFLNTPNRISPAINKILEACIVFKDETANPIKSFKGRGTSHYVTGLKTEQPLVCASAGNFGQGLAWAAHKKQLPLVVFAANKAVACKVNAMRLLHADVRLGGDDFDAAKALARDFAQREGFLYVEDGADITFAEGAGTLAYELTRDEIQAFDTVMVPLGNGALAAGVGTWFKSETPMTRIVTVSATGAPAMAMSVRSGNIETTSHTETIADGIAVRVPIAYAVDAVRQVIDDVVLVDDTAIKLAMGMLQEHLNLIIEPAGAAGLAAIIADTNRWKNHRIAVPLCGGNVDDTLLRIK
jgi:threonine dehydratase